MAVTQSYYGVRDDDHSPHAERSSHRVASTGGYYERAVPYTYYDNSRQDPRPNIEIRQMNHTIIHEPQEPKVDHQSGYSRRRIAVACSRCRRRKIKCTGDPGDGSGCQSCRNSASDIATCNFIRVKSTQYFLKDAEGLPTTSCMAPQSMGGQVQNTPIANDARLSLPHLQTRPNFTVDYEQYDASPIEGYNFSATLHRQDSFIGSFNGENCRSWPMTTSSLPAPATTTYYESHPTYTLNGAMSSYQPMMPYSFSPTTRLASTTADSPLSMGALHSSLPIQTTQERRLPAPYNPQSASSPLSNTDLPEIRPLGGSFDGPHDHVNGIHSRHAMPWSTNSNLTATSPESVNENHRSAHGLITQTRVAQVPPTTTTEPVLGYQFNVANSNENTITTSSEHSPVSFLPQAGIDRRRSSSSSSEVSSMPAPNNWSTSYQPVSTYCTTRDDNHYGTRVAPLPSLYSVNNEAAGTTGRSFPMSNERERTLINCHSYTPLRYPEAIHAASLENLKRHASPPATNRVLMSSLDGRYV
ncbi:Hypothetical protein R9X50_00615800 [Acrodontium crateriforme]|uniref:Zn(2)-C6 fungal-type domain-containing protein n=1 Tax=Acrodontium crateriforme TaxID=150365 RepID=A0AAQ3MB15_9PEZI|nr:Hypothetical protein R9X50_00615800 [Acrodontium crateriforme]